MQGFAKRVAAQLSEGVTEHQIIERKLAELLLTEQQAMPVN